MCVSESQVTTNLARVKEWREERSEGGIQEHGVTCARYDKNYHCGQWYQSPSRRVMRQSKEVCVTGVMGTARHSIGG